MMLILTILFISVASVLGEDDECDLISPYEKCRQYAPDEELRDIKVVPDKDELTSICPNLLKYFECFTDFIDECGRQNEHFTVIEFIENTYEIVKELCNEESELHRGYTASAECYKTLEGTGESCEEEAKDIYRTYFEYIKREHPERVDAIHKSSQQMCMVQSYSLACLSEKILKDCGELAQTTLLDIVSRSQYLRQFCSQSMVDELQSTFLDLLQMEEDDLEVYKNAFYVMKK